MKKAMVWLLGVGVMLAVAVPASAEDLEVQLIGGEDTTVGAASLDDVQLEETYEIDGFAKITPLSFEFVDYFPQYASGMNGVNSNESFNLKENKVVSYWVGGGERCFDNIYWMSSGTNAEYAWFLVDITNAQKIPVDYMDEEMVQVKVVSDEEYEFVGWVRQFNYDYDVKRTDGAVESDRKEYGDLIRAAIQPDSAEPVDMLYTGHYAFGCTLPNAVVNGEEALSMVITLGDSEITYNIRK